MALHMPHPDPVSPDPVVPHPGLGGERLVAPEAVHRVPTAHVNVAAA